MAQLYIRMARNIIFTCLQWSSKISETYLYYISYTQNCKTVKYVNINFNSILFSNHFSIIIYGRKQKASTTIIPLSYSWINILHPFKGGYTMRYYWFTTTWQGGNVGGQHGRLVTWLYNRIFSGRICMKIEFSSRGAKCFCSWPLKWPSWCHVN